MTKDKNNGNKENKGEQPKTDKAKHHINSVWGISVIIIIVASMSLAVWYFWFYQTATQSLASFKRPSNFALIMKQKEEKSGIKTYTNNAAEFYFEYPFDWTLKEGHNTILLSSDAQWPRDYLSGAERIMKPDDIYIQIHFSNKSFDSSREAPAIKPKITNDRVGNIKVRKVTYKNEAIFAQIIPNFEAANFLYTIIADTQTKNSDKIEAYDKMLGSFKFGDELNKN